jgi:hypothetical protein
LLLGLGLILLVQAHRWFGVMLLLEVLVILLCLLILGEHLLKLLTNLLGVHSLNVVDVFHCLSVRESWLEKVVKNRVNEILVLTQVVTLTFLSYVLYKIIILLKFLQFIVKFLVSSTLIIRRD